MSWKRAILAGMVFLVCLLLLVLDRQLVSQRILQRVQESSLAPGINLGEVVEARVRNRSGETLLTKEGSQWKIRAPFDAQADAELVEQMLVNVTAARRNNEVDVKNLAEYGLASPEIELLLKTSKGQSFELALGNESTYTGQVFAQYPKTDTVFTVGDHVRSVLVRSPRDWRRARLLEVDTGRLESYKRIRIESPNGLVDLRADGGRWTIVSPVQAVAETEIVNDFLRKAGLVRAGGFLTADSDKPTSMATALQALAAPALTLTLDRADGVVVKLAIGRAGDTGPPVYVAQRVGDAEIMVITPSTFNDLNEDENHFRSRGIFSMTAADARTFTIDIGRLRTELVRGEDGKWQFLDTPDRRVDQDQVQVRLESLLSSRVRDYVDLQPADPGNYGFAPAQFRYTVVNKDGTVTEGLEVGRRESGNVGSVYARRVGDQAIFSLDLSPELVISPESVADRKFARVNPAQVARFEVDMEGVKHVFRRQGNEWQVLKPGQAAFTTANAGRVQRVFAVLNELEFDRDHAAKGETVIAPGDETSMRLTFLASEEAEEAMLTFRVGRRLAETSYVSTSDRQTYDVRNRDLDVLLGALQSLLQ